MRENSVFPKKCGNAGKKAKKIIKKGIGADEIPEKGGLETVNLLKNRKKSGNS